MVHPKVLEAYNQSYFDYVPTTADKVEENFLNAVTLGQEHRPVKPFITQLNSVVRLRPSQRQDYYYYHETVRGEDPLGNSKAYTRCVGQYDMPVFRMEYEPREKRAVAREIIQKRTEYEFPYDKEKLTELLDNAIVGHTHFYLKLPNNVKYEITSKDDFIDATFDELVTMTRPGSARTLAEIRAASKPINKIVNE